MRRFFPHLLIVGLVAAAYTVGWLAPIDRVATDLGFTAMPRSASGNVIVVEIDSKSLRTLDVWPWPRTYHGILLDRLMAAGARNVAFDIEFSSHSSAAADGAFADALRRAQGRAILPILKQLIRTEDGGSEVAVAVPIPKFRRHVRLAHVNIRPATDDLIRHYMNREQFGEVEVPGLASQLAGNPQPALDVFEIDFAISPESVPRLSYVDVMQGKFDRAAVAGKDIIVGAVAIELGDRMPTPVHGVIAGPLVQALAYETLVQDRMLLHLADWPALVFTFLMAVLLGPLLSAWTLRRGLAVLAITWAMLFAISIATQNQFALLVDITPSLLIPLGSYGYAVVRRINRQAAAIRRERVLSLHRRAMMSAVVESSFDGIVVTDENGTIEMTNAAAEKMVGWEVGKVVGRSVNDIVPAQGSSPYGGDLHAKIETFDYDHTLPREVNIRRVDGGTFAAELIITPSRMSISSQRAKLDNTERILRIYTFRDITERKRAEEQTREKDDAIAANETKSEFLATMSHELRTPMNGVLGMLGLILDTGLTKKQHEYVRTAHDSANALLTLLNDILDMSKLEAGKIELEIIDFNFAKTMDQILALLSTRAQEKGVEIRSDFCAEIPQWLRADEGHLRQVVFNLMGNAIKFTEQGSVTISASHRICDDQSVELRCEIVDTGIGMSVEDQQNLFSRFAQADGSISRRFGGTGLGLAICKQLVELMGGAIGVHSNPGEGSTFWFTMPCVLGEPADVRETEVKSGAPIKTRPLRILVAEDNHVNQKVVGALLIGAGHSVDMVANGLEAIDAVVSRSYDLVLMDVNMPEMDGIEASKKIRAEGGERKDIPIIALTASAMKGDKERFLLAGMNDYVSKPIDRVKLNEAIAHQCGGIAEIDRSAPINSNEAPTEAHDELAGLMDTLDELMAATG